MLLRYRLNLLLFFGIIATLVSASPTTATASSIYLRPNGDRATEKPWAIIGANHAWEALDDNVTEKQTPTNADYIRTEYSLTKHYMTSTEVELSSTSLTG